MGGQWPSAGPRCRPVAGALANEVALVSAAKRELLLGVHRHRLRREDLEDCYSQATLELLSHVRAGGSYASRQHIGNALELRFLSRIRDRRRAISGRSPMQAAIEQAAELDQADSGGAIADHHVTVESLVMLRDELREIIRLARCLSADQRAVLGSQLAGEQCSDFCDRTGWSREKYRKVAQRARARLRTLAICAAPAVPSERPASEQVSGTTYEPVLPHT